jgi:cellulose synthase/poly-beta-1,6-N-acetylglucosamine synthase-like glycosyltransferase
MAGLFILFITTAALLWLSAYGYLFALWAISFRRRRIHQEISRCPDIAIVIPTLNEEDSILSKITNLKNSDYPHNHMTVLVVDGGSTDQTQELVKQEIERGQEIRLVRLEGSRGKTHQISHAFSLLKQDIVVVTDADSTLEASCIKELVAMLVNDPNIAIVGTTIKPQSILLEERLHWKFLNYLWWLEGEVLSAAGISAVCYACRREKVLFPDQNAKADDIHLALMAAGQGHPVRICRKAYATETRVPQTAGELLRFRRRRGGAYVSALLQSKKYVHTAFGYHLARLMRIWHFLITPKIAVALFLLSIMLLRTADRWWLIPAFTAFITPALAILLTSNILNGEKLRWLRLGWAAVRLFTLTLISMLTLNSHPSAQGPIGGRP